MEHQKGLWPSKRDVFEGIEVSVPNNVTAFLYDEFQGDVLNECKSPDYDHKNEQFTNGIDVTVNCKDLMETCESYFPDYEFRPLLVP